MLKSPSRKRFSPDYSRRVDGLYRVEGATLGERFRGQALTKGAPNSSLADFDVLSNTAAAAARYSGGPAAAKFELAEKSKPWRYRLVRRGVEGLSPAAMQAVRALFPFFFAEPQFGFGFRVKASKADGSAYGLGVIQIVCFNAGGARVGDVVLTASDGTRCRTSPTCVPTANAILRDVPSPTQTRRASYTTILFSRIGILTFSPRSIQLSERKRRTQGNAHSGFGSFLRLRTSTPACSST